MPNVNFTSSSIAQQDRFAQTTVSYESRNMQSIPFYPDVDHKAKFRGIFALTMIWAVVIGAIFGLLFGFRDVIFRAASSSAVAAWFDNDAQKTTAVPDSIDTEKTEKINFSLAASELEPWDYLVQFSQISYSAVYDGTGKFIPRWDDSDIYIQPVPGGTTYKLVFKYIKSGDSYSSAKTVTSAADLPKDAGSYIIWIYAKDESTGIEYPNSINNGERYLEIKKADIKNFPGIDISEVADKYTGSEMPLKVMDNSELSALGVDGNVKFIIEYKAFGANSYVKVDKVLNAGDYKITLEVEGNDNVNSKKFESDVRSFTVGKATVSQNDLNAAKDAFPDVTVTYNGEKQVVEFNKEMLPALIQSICAEESTLITTPVYSGIDAVTIGNDAINAGTYNVRFTISSQNYNDIELSAKLVIEKANLIDFFDFKDTFIKYTGKTLTSTDSAIVINNIKSAFPSADTIQINYIYDDIENSDNNIGLVDILKVGTYRITAIFKYIDGAYQNFILPDDGTVTKILEIGKGDIPLSDVTIKTYTVPYSGNKIILPKEYVKVNGLLDSEYDIKIDAELVDAGTYEVPVTIYGENYNETSATAIIVIEKISFGNRLNLKYQEKQTVKKNGKMLLPTHSSIPEAYNVDYLINGKSIKEAGGVDKLGNYKIDIVVSDKNHINTYTVDFTIEFNPLSIVFGLVLGIIAGIIIALLIWLGYRRLEEASYKAFKGVRLRLQHERGGDRGAIVCEGRVTIINWNSEQEHRDFPWIVEPRFGRLFLTHATLEFYDSSCSGGNIKTYKNYRNFLIQIKEITGVEIRGAFFRSKLIVFARGARHVFYVEPNTAYLWRRDILHFRDLAHLYPMENNVVDNNYPFNYTLMETKGTDPHVPKNV